MSSKNNNPGRILKGTKATPTLKSASGIWTLDEALQYHRANQWPQPNLFQPVSNSLRSKASSTSYFYRNTPRYGNRMTWTWSAWFKRSTIGASTGNRNGLFGSGDSSQANLFRLYFDATDHLVVQDTQSADNLVVVTTQVFRDTNAWYHVVVAVDMTQSTGSNRVKIYVNGVQVTLFSTATYASQGYATMVNGGHYETTGACYNPPTTAYVVLDGYIAEHNFIDGQAVSPTLFGQFDSNGVWVPIPYTGSYGTNGFYLPFSNTQSSQTLGYDASLNGTPTYTADQDPYRGSVSLHLTGNGSVGGQNNTFIDSSVNNTSVTRQGSVINQGSFSPFPFNTNTTYNPAVHGGSAYFNNTPGENLLVGASSVNAIGTSAFTVEAWIWLKSKSDVTGNGSHYIISQGNNNNNTMWALQVNSAGTSIVWGYTGASVTVTTTVNMNTWNHIAVTRDGSNNERIFLNGALINTRTNTTNYNSVSGYQIQIGSTYDTNYPSAYSQPSYSNTLFGYIGGVRLIIGSAVYTTNFTPTMRPFGALTNNLLTWSEDFTNTQTWPTPTGIIVTPNSAIAPDGSSNGTMITSTAVFAGASIATQTIRASDSNAYTYSIYVKAGTLYSFRHRVAFTGGTTGLGLSVDVNLNTGTIVSGEAGYTSASITPVGNGWYRLSITASNNGTGNTNYITQLYPGALQSGVTGTLYIWGAQYEQASSMGNYTPTPANYSTAPNLLLNFTGASIVDSAGANTATTVNTLTITSSSKFGSGALVFNSVSNSYATMPGAVGTTNFSTGDFTVECWWRANGTQSNYTPIISQGFIGSPPAGAWGLKVTGSNTNIQFTYDASLVNVGQNINSNINANDGQWHHLAVTRNLSKLYLFIDGILVGNNSIPSSQVVGNLTSDIFIGYHSRDGSYATGSVDDLRITKGVARYIDSFVPPTRALPETGGKSLSAINVNAGVVQRFINVGSTSWTAPSDVTQIEVLVVAGGGQGGSSHGGGGGGGGVIYNSAYPVTPGQTYTVTVGAGGLTAANPAVAGGSSVFGNLIAIGGGAGGNETNAGYTGGSGGGGGGKTNGSASGTSGQGFASGNGSNSVGYGGGGGGGAGAVGSVGGSSGGAGGIGLQFGISGTPTYYAGGGGGNGYAGSNNGGTGGLGGGGAGGVYGGSTPVTGVAGTANTGGGGGGNYLTGQQFGMSGGSGIVIVRYTTSAVANTSDATTDNLLDSPTLYGHDMGMGGEVVGNYATWNSIDNWLSGQAGISGISWQNGGLTISNVSAGWVGQRATIAYPSSGKYYYEVRIDSGSGPGVSSGVEIGIIGTSSLAAISAYLDGNTSAYCYRLSGAIYVAGSIVNQSVAAYNIGDVIGVAYDADARSLTFYKNGVAVYSAITVTAGTYTPALSTYATVAVTTNFGQRQWTFNPPAGYTALTTKNLPRPTGPALTPNQYFDTITYTGTGATNNIVLPGAFQPDLIWIKCRSATNSHIITDSVRGANKTLYSDLINAESTNTDRLMSFNSNGFTLGVDASQGVNFSGQTHVAWCWKKGAAQGFDIQTYTSGGSTDTITHALGTTPAMVIVKSRSSGAANWWVYHIGTGTAKSIQLNANSAAVNDTWVVNSTQVQYNYGIASGQTAVMYLWATIPGFSSFGSYTGTGAATGVFVNTGFKPRYLMIRNVTSTGSWVIIDSARNYNPAGSSTSNNELRAESNVAESSGPQDPVDILSNGFKVYSTGTATNNLNDRYVYAAFADVPFGNANGTAR
jgi:hypothetical protein